VLYHLWLSAIALLLSALPLTGQADNTISIDSENDWDKTFSIPSGWTVKGGLMLPCLTVILLNQDTKHGYVRHFLHQNTRDFNQFLSEVHRLERRLYQRKFEPRKFSVFISGRASPSTTFSLTEPGEINRFFEKAGFTRNQIVVRLLPHRRKGELILNEKGIVELSVTDQRSRERQMPIEEWPYFLDCLRVSLEESLR
jgi:hypothetical protein